jgi:hypothetical protein
MKDLIKESLRWSAQAEDGYRFVSWMKKRMDFMTKPASWHNKQEKKMLRMRYVIT